MAQVLVAFTVTLGADQEYPESHARSDKPVPSVRRRAREKAASPSRASRERLTANASYRNNDPDPYLRANPRPPS
jgi:hypothetical protein